jgi:hypothetical protein
MTGWEWQGHAGHFIGAMDCIFHLHTHVTATDGRRFCVSTVGDYWPNRGADAPAEIGFRRLYETMVFRLSDDGTTVNDYSELEMRPYNDKDAANAGHIETCQRWATQAGEERGDDR